MIALTVRGEKERQIGRSKEAESERATARTVTPNFPDRLLPLFSPVIVGTQRASLMEQVSKTHCVLKLHFHF